MTFHDLPAINAVLNSVATVFIIAGFIQIKAGRRKAHGICMAVALVASTAFLTCYLTYHWLLTKETGQGHTNFGTEYGSGIRQFYIILLITHIFLAVVNLPMIIATVWFAARRRFDRHRRIARWTLPVWLYVSITGVIVYFMLYQWYPPAELRARQAKAALAR